eukprot:6207218-Pleurochrysis_carterae.AAC.4
MRNLDGNGGNGWPQRLGFVQHRGRGLPRSVLPVLARAVSARAVLARAVLSTVWADRVAPVEVGRPRAHCMQRRHAGDARKARPPSERSLLPFRTEHA